MPNNENQTKHCKYCQSEIPAAASVCSQCGRKQKGKLKWILIVIFVLIFLGALGSAMGDSGQTSTPASDSGTETKAETVEILDVSPAELLDAYETNEVKADALYDGKTLRLSGTVESIGKDILDDIYITFAGEEFSITSVQCYFSDDAQIQQVMELQEGDSVTVVGVCDGYFMNVCVNNCVFE
ncbi:hypothetical protein H9X85_03085 [Anaerotignum lactatifermentans]|uniref:tRNA_anti-like n=1 Tax=Anaerotignum lactatifermentans TaxID=160404 RepID=A0ABS2GAJ8_9FIRM|nr:hypothetical protein [Anaerotignum lactatifermentans]MBM6828617.1 hypothetical protein [Anaerotignum lactatifermentans]MBM6878511.1 hypothetical protein [Anaerotignum lactatifermentans]MBM6950199.1 hypothetical protein [Anaerotignum lactatifermentans]